MLTVLTLCYAANVCRKDGYKDSEYTFEKM